MGCLEDRLKADISNSSINPICIDRLCCAVPQLRSSLAVDGFVAAKASDFNKSQQLSRTRATDSYQSFKNENIHKQNPHLSCSNGGLLACLQLMQPPIKSAPGKQ